MSYSTLFNEKSAIEDDKYYVTADPARVDVNLKQSEVEQHEPSPAALQTAAVTPIEASETTDNNVPDNTNHNDPVVEHEEEPKPNTQEQETTKHVQLSRSGNAEAAGLQNLNNAPDDARGETREEKDRKSFSSFLERVQLQRQMLLGLADWMDQHAQKEFDIAEQLRKTIAQNTARMMENSAFIGEAEAFLEKYDGKNSADPADKAKMVKALQKRGVDVDDNIPFAILLSKVSVAMSDANKENADLEKNNTTLDKEATEHETEGNRFLDGAKDIRNRVEAVENQNLDPEDEYKALQAIYDDYPQEVVYKYKVEHNVTDQALDDQRNKAADKVALNDDAEGFFGNDDDPDMDVAQTDPQQDDNLENKVVVNTPITPGGPGGMG